jgi:uroporphyrinogen decarboxylase
MNQRDSAVRPRFLQACRGQPVDRVPVWFMRQAGRSLPEYRDLRERHSILELIRKPDLAVEVTMQPLKRYDVDAAILFSDIVVPLLAMGIDLSIEEGVGPVIERPIRSRDDVDRLKPLDVEQDVGFVLEAVAILAGELDVPLIGFAGAPFTLACYLVEGGPSKDYASTKALMYSEPRVWGDLMDRLADAIQAYLSAQIAAGASAVQLFDSWVGALSRSDFERLVRPSVERILKGLEQHGTPRIYFGVNTSELLVSFPGMGADVVGIDHRVPLDEARRRVGGDVTLQGNLDPAVCLAPWKVVEERALEVLRRGGGTRHVFNLGHGVLPQTDHDTMARITDLVHEWDLTQR